MRDRKSDNRYTCFEIGASRSPTDTGRRRYPVVYALHGYSIGAEQWSRELHVPQTLEGAFALGAKEMIVVLPDSKTMHNGSMYSSSVTTGDFENYIARDVVAYMDAHYRTIPERRSRGLVGHSMGGYGATLHEILDGCGVQNSFEIYQGTHTSAVADRFQNHVMPFFSRNLVRGPLGSFALPSH
jgi:hypothetical protein